MTTSRLLDAVWSMQGYAKEDKGLRLLSAILQRFQSMGYIKALSPRTQSLVACVTCVLAVILIPRIDVDCYPSY